MAHSEYFSRLGKTDKIKEGLGWDSIHIERQNRLKMWQEFFLLFQLELEQSKNIEACIL